MNQEKVMSKIRNITITLLLLLVATAADAQATVSARLDSMRIPFGGQTTLRLRVGAPKGVAVVMPQLKAGQMLVDSVMVVEQPRIDSKNGGDSVVSELSAPITSFTPGRYTLPGLKVGVGGKQLVANTLTLVVDSVALDKQNPQKTYPPKDIQRNPFSWADWWLPLLLLVVVVAAVVGIVLAARRLCSHKPLRVVVREVRVVPAHQRALDRIAQLKSQMPQDSKEYYTSLTDVLRQFISERFGFNAMEMTSEEIIDRLDHEADKDKADELRQVLSTADLAKFAKYSTAGVENEQNLQSVARFISDTKLDQQEHVVKAAPELTAQQQAIASTRRICKWLMAVLSMVAVAAVVAIVALVVPLLADI